MIHFNQMINRLLVEHKTNNIDHLELFANLVVSRYSTTIVCNPPKNSMRERERVHLTSLLDLIRSKIVYNLYCTMDNVHCIRSPYIESINY